VALRAIDTKISIGFAGPDCLAGFFVQLMGPMFFIAAKLFGILTAPSHVLGVLVLAAGLCLLLRWYRAGRVLAVLAALLLVAAGMSPLPVLMVKKLEDRYPRPAWPAHVDGVLILGGGEDTALLKARHAPQQNGAAYRLVEAFAAARHYPQARVVFTGGSGLLMGQAFSEAETARYVLDELGLDPARLTLEQASRNTYENILFSRHLVKPQAGQVWLLATSAIQMPRAMAVAEKQGWKMVPWPTDYITAPQASGDWLDVAGNLGLADYATHEWIGLLAYRLTGKV
jgi:uncharacterized SAM-binding protein YcdF (DUF218 family)